MRSSTREFQSFNLLRHYTFASLVIIIAVMFATVCAAITLTAQVYLRIEQEEADSLVEDIAIKLSSMNYPAERWSALPKELQDSPEIQQKLSNFEITEFTLLDLQGTELQHLRKPHGVTSTTWDKGFAHAANNIVACRWAGSIWGPLLYDSQQGGCIESYVPVKEQDKVVGVVRLHRDMAKVLMRDHSVIPMLLALTGISGAIVFLGLWFVIRRADYTIRLQRKAIERANEELSAMNGELSAANKSLAEINRQKDYILSVCSHDIRSPLISIVAGNKILAKERIGPLTDAQRDIVQRNQQSAQNVLDLTASLLDLARLENGAEQLNMDNHNLLEVVNESCAAQRLHAEDRGVDIRVVCSVPELHVEADRLKLLRVCNNLLSNAIKHSKRDTEVVLELAVNGDDVCISVKDQGPGIPKEQQAALFDKFSALARNKRNRDEGTGLGLSITQALVQLHDGRICVLSELGKGSTFQVILPRRASTRHTTPAAIPTNT